MSRIFRGLVLALAVILVACGGESDDPEPTATTATGQEQEALPTVPPVDSTPEADVSEEEITVVEPEIPATSVVSTPEATAGVLDSDVDSEATPPSTPTDDAEEVVDPATTLAEDEGPATIVAEASTPSTQSTIEDPATAEVDSTESGVATPSPDDASTAEVSAESDSSATASPDASVDEDTTATSEATAAASTPETSDDSGTSNETFTNPGDGTGGSGMPGEQDSNVPESEGGETPVASPGASPIAQLSISGCEVPDVPGFLGESNIFLLTADVNFRSGPGVDCEPVFDEPIGEGQLVLVLGGPVTQADDGTEWVLIEVDGEPGWVTTEFLEPSE